MIDHSCTKEKTDIHTLSSPFCADGKPPGQFIFVFVFIFPPRILLVFFWVVVYSCSAFIGTRGKDLSKPLDREARYRLDKFLDSFDFIATARLSDVFNHFLALPIIRIKGDTSVELIHRIPLGLLDFVHLTSLCIPPSPAGLRGWGTSSQYHRLQPLVLS